MEGRACKLGLLVLAAIILPGCLATTPAKPYNQSAFKKGTIVLSCKGIGCGFSWGSSSAKMRSQYDSRQWDELARTVVATNYPYNLAYYYLGRASEGKGHYGAAANYYRAAQVAKKCKSFINVCSGLDVPTLTATRLKLVANASVTTTGMSMADAQAHLKSLGWYTGTVDGLYGPRTTKSLKDYQYSVGLPQTGIVDTATANALAGVAPSTSIGTARKPVPASVQAKSAKEQSTQSFVAVNHEDSVGKTVVLLSKAEILDNPDPFAKIIATIARGSRVKLVELNGEWALIEYDDKKGYVYTDQLR